MYKRNFTFGLATPATVDDGASWALSGTGAATDWTLKDGSFPPGTDGHDLTSIACAVNLFNQDDIFAVTTHNGLCYNGATKPGRGT
jgi:hypothetical protein